MVISEERLRAPGATSADVLAQVPGVQTSRAGSSSDHATASIRGATSAQTPVYLAGIRLNDDLTGTADLSTLPLWMLARVDVFRGNAPEHADHLGIGGAIFFEPKLPDRTRVGVGSSMGSFGQWSAWTGGALAAGAASALFAVRREQADNRYGFTDDRGTRFDPTDDREVWRSNADFEAYDAWVIGRHEIGRGARTLFVANAFYREQGIPGLAVIPARAARSRTQRMLGAVSSRVPCSTWRVGEAEGSCIFEVSSTWVVTRSTVSDPWRELSMQATDVAISGTRLAQQARLGYMVSDDLRFGASALEAVEQVGVDTVASPPLRARRESTRLAGTMTWQPLPWLGLHALSVLQRQSTSGVEHAQGSRAIAVDPVGRFGIEVRPFERMQILMNIGRYVRVPTLGELHGLSYFVRGNSGLVPEQGLTADLGTRLWREGTPCASCALYVDAFLFGRSAQDLIAFKRSSFGVIRPFNVGAARVLGAELAAGADVLDAIRVELSMTALDPRDVSPSRRVKNDFLPFQSRLVVSPSVEVYADPALPQIAMDRAAVGVRLLYRSSRFADPAGLVVLRSQAVTDLDASAHFFHRSMAVRFAMRNIFDTQQFDAIGFPLPGRSVHGNLEVWW
ncbi:TonB-dependent receptor [Sorangium sp. So ce295]|uniref:TonB-dependent receptor domain-containing protein n=1 Tax=Sorangium sp. So ce295 TaxID=3133295 RepID=UPI003F5DB32C